MSDPPPSLKFISAYLSRADEVRAKEPIVAYYCSFYAAKLALEKNPQDTPSRTYLFALLDRLEADKAQIGDNEAITNDIVGYAHVENFALKVFNAADNEDRNGHASKKTAKNFLAASTFLDVLAVFGPVDESVTEKSKYARFKAVEIMKAFKDGALPRPGPPQSPAKPSESTHLPPTSFPPPSSSPVVSFQDTTAPVPSNSPPVSSPQIARTPSQPSAPAAQPHWINYPNQAPSVAQPIPAAPSVPTPQTAVPKLPLDYKVIEAATKHSRFAISALQYEDIPTAIANLEKALALLRQ